MEKQTCEMTNMTHSQSIDINSSSLSLLEQPHTQPLFTCILVGEGTLLAQCARFLIENHCIITQIISEDVQIQRFATEMNIAIGSSLESLEETLNQSPTDYLFSITNHRILPDHLLKKVKKLAINYHDAPLPQYAGMNATYWALVNNETTHGISWHIIEAGIDTGDILKQKAVTIDENDSSFTLNIKCFEAAFQGFTELIDDLNKNTLVRTKQNPEKRSYYSGRKKSPSGGIIPWHQGAQFIEKLCLASDFGFYPNELGIPKIWTGKSLVWVSKATAEKSESTRTAGTIVALESDAITIATSTYDVRISQLAALDGEAISISAFLEDNTLQVGSVLPELSSTITDQIEQWDSQLHPWQIYWVEKLSHLQPTRLPFTSRLPLSHTQGLHQVKVDLSAGTQHFLSTYQPESQSVQFLISAFIIYLARITGTTQIQTGFTSDQLMSKCEGLLDLFASSVPLQTEVALDGDFEIVYKGVVAELTKTQQAQTFAKDLIARYTSLRNKSECKESPLFPIVIAQTQQIPESCTNPGRELTIWISDDAKNIRLLANASRLDLTSVQRIASQFSTLLSNLIQNLHEPIAKHALLSESEHHTILEEWNATTQPYASESCMHHLFEKQATLTPDAIAILFENQQLTYAQLNGKANQLAHLLQQKGAGPGMLIGISMDKSVEMVIGVLGIQKAGSAYVPLDPTAPKDRLGLVLDDLKLTLLITQARFEHVFEEKSFEVIAVDTHSGISQQPNTNPVSAVTANDLAYVIYTSGSTGIPKGVVVRHRPVINLIEWVNQTFQMGASDRVLFVNSLGFDLSVYDIFGMLAAGGSVRIASKSELQNPQQLLEILYNEPITLWNSAPATLSQLVPFSSIVALPTHTQLRLAFLSGDWIPLALPGWITQNFTQTEVISLGGATEATVWSNYFRIPRQLDEQWVSIPYGFPIQNARYHILDSYLQPVPVGVAAELYIGGQCLADGYLNRPELNEEKFIADPFTNGRLYKTGDLARYMPDGNIEFLGRKDHQVKIRGYRIELGEIEAVLTENPHVQDLIVTAQADSSGNKRLIAYLVLTTPQAITTAELRAFLKEKLPDYMIPSLFVFLDAMPLNPSGKIDRKALPHPGLNEDIQRDYVSPQTPSEYLVSELWCTILQLPKISIHANFFEIGGHSLLGVQFISRLKQKTGYNIPLLLLFSHPTIASFASLLDEKTDGSEWDVLIPIRTTGSRSPLYCVHPITGGVEYVKKLADNLTIDQPLYGLQAVGLNGVDTPLSCAYAMAEKYLQAILQKQPQGPYHLAGYSVGGLIAYEMALRLKKMGHQVDSLWLIDTYPAQKQRILTYDHVGIKYIAQSWCKLMLRTDISWRNKLEIIHSMREMQKDFVKMLSTHFKLSTQKAPTEAEQAEMQEDFDSTTLIGGGLDSHYQQWEKILTGCWIAARNYRHVPYDGKVVFIRAKENVAKYLTHSDFGWKKYVRPSSLQIYEVEGDHFSLFKNETSLEQIGAIFKTELSELTLAK